MRTKTRSLLPLIVSAGILLFSVLAACASPVTVKCTAQVTSSYAAATELPVGTIVTGSYTYDTSTLDSWSDTPQYGLYNGAITAMQMSFGGVTHTLDSTPNSIEIDDNTDGFPFMEDHLFLDATVSGNYNLQFSIHYNGGNEWNSDALPLKAPRIPTDSEDGYYEFLIYARNRGGQDIRCRLLYLSLEKPLAPPVANAGTDLAVSEGALVNLDGSASSDGNIPPHALSYVWSQLSGPPVVVSGADTAAASFTAPLVPNAGASLVFQLTVSNYAGSSTDTVTVNVANVNNPPVANAGAEQTVGENTVVALNGSGSSDADGDTLTLQWSQISGPTVALSGADTVSPSFTAPEVTAVQGTVDLVFQLIVNDGMVSSGPSTVTVHVANMNDAPTAKAGADQTVNELSLVTLDGTGSSDPDNNTLSYNWSQIAGPSVSLSGADTVSPTFTAPELNLGGEPGSVTLTFQLTVNDGYESSTSTVNVQVSNVNHAPVADAGADQTIAEGSTVTLDGSGSADEDGDAISYLWVQTGGPEVVLDDASSASPTFTAPDVGIKGGLVTFSLTVTDVFGASSSDDVIVTVSYVNNPPTIAIIDAPASVDEFATITLTAATGDVDGNRVVVTWQQIGGPAIDSKSSGKTGGAAPAEAPAEAPSKGGGATGMSFTFTAPRVDRFEADLVFRATADDGQRGIATAEVTIHINNLNNAPVAQAPANVTSPEGSPVILVGQGFDPDKEENKFLTYAWSQTAGPEVELVPDGANVGFIAPMINSGDPTASVTLTFTLTVTDPNGASSTDDVDVVVTNEEHAPVANAGGNVSANEATSVTLNGTGSSDPDGDALTFSWVQISGPAVVLNDANTAYPYFTTPFVNAAGATLQFQITVSDGFETSTDVATVTVANINDPPTVNNASPSVAVLWPVNHSMISVSILGVIDPNNNATVRITGVTQDEPTNGLGDGDTAIDAIINANGTVLLRAERAGNGNGRVYHIHFTASDFEGSASGVVTVSVPKSKKTDAAVDGGELYDSTR